MVIEAHEFATHECAAHEFAFYYEYAETLPAEGTFSLKEAELIGRIKNVVRLAAGQTCILFDGKKRAIRWEIIHVQAREIIGKIIEIIAISSPIPQVQWLLPVLKKNALEEACSHLTVFGVETIQLVITQKTSRPLPDFSKLQERLKRIMIAAAEQSKQYILPIILEPITLQKACDSTQKIKIFFDAAGNPCSAIFQSLQQMPVTSMICLTGPEGDLTPEEKKYCLAQNFIFCALGTSILRAETAVTLGAGIIRSFLPNKV